MIEFAVLLRLLRDGAVALLLAAMLGAAAVTVLVRAYDAVPHEEVIVSLTFRGLAPNENIAYDGYYIIESERRFGDILGYILVREDLRDTMAKDGVSMGRISRVSPLDYRVAFSVSEDGVKRGAFLATFKDTVEGLLTDAVERSGEPIIVSVSLSDAIVLPTTWTLPKSLFVGALLGIFFGVVFLLLRHAALPEGILVREVIEVEID